MHTVRWCWSGSRGTGCLEPLLTSVGVIIFINSIIKTFIHSFLEYVCIVLVPAIDIAYWHIVKLIIV